jgi:hypothetical protein
LGNRQALPVAVVHTVFPTAIKDTTYKDKIHLVVLLIETLSLLFKNFANLMDLFTFYDLKAFNNKLKRNSGTQLKQQIPDRIAV